MAPVIDRIISNPAQAAELLRPLRDQRGYADLSDVLPRKRLTIVTGAELERIRIAERDIHTNFAECTFRDSEFHRVNSKGHFWGAQDKWERCVFSETDLTEMISPFNAFTDCTFNRVKFDRYVACETTFDGCRFSNCEFQSLSVVQCHALRFVGCDFHQTKFGLCELRGVEFRNCRFTEVTADRCDFSGIDADMQWWRDSSNADLFVIFLDQAIEAFRRAIGPQSVAARLLREYREGYVDGKITTQDFSAVLYTGEVECSEMDIVEDILEEIGARFGY